MPSWKKVIVSGSSPHFNEITASGNISGSITSTGSFGHVRMDGKDLPPIFTTGNSIYLGQGGTGTGDDGSANNNVGIGYDVLSDIGTGARNVAIGLSAMANRVSSSENVAIGYRAGGPGAQKMGQNTLVGVDAGYSLDGSGGTYNATSNTFIGHQAGDGATSGLKNTAVGDNSARSLVAGSSNVFLGYFSGNGGNTEGGTYIGQYASATDGATNEIVIGKSAVGKGSNTVVLGDDNITDIYMSEDVGAMVHVGNISGSATSTGSFGHLLVNGSVVATSPDATDGSQNTISGSITSTGSFGSLNTGQIIVSGSEKTSDIIQIYNDAGGAVGYAGITFDLDNSTNDAEAYLRLDRTSGTAFLGLTMQSDGRDGMRFMTGTTERLRIDGDVVSGSINSTGSFGALKTSGDVHIGTSGSVPFHSGGGLGIRHATTARIKLQTESSGSDVGSGFEFTTGGQAAIVNRDSRNLVVYGHSNLEHMRFTYTGGQTRIGMFTSADPGFHTGNGLCIGGQTTTTRVRIATSNTGTGASDGLEIVYSPSNGAFIYNNESENLHIGTGGTSTVFGLKNGATADLLALDGNKISGSITSTGSFGSFNNDFIPSADNTHDLGSSDNRWANIHSADLHLSNENTNGNEVDGTTGNWTIQEGEDDLYLLNRKNGKKYKFKLEEVT